MDITAILSGAFLAAFGPTAAGYALAAVGLNVHFGYTGLLNFGQVAFMLVGAYGMAISVSVFGLSLLAGVLIGVACAVVLALLLGAPTLRLRSDYLAIATIAAGEILRIFYRSSYAEPVTGGVYGLQQFAEAFYALNPIPQGRYGLGAALFSSRDLWVMIMGWGLVALASVLVYRLIHSPWGRVIRSIREDENAALSLGKDVYSYKMQSLVLGGIIGALGGMVLAISTQSVSPNAYLPVVTFFLYTLLILGGAGRIAGPIIGSVLFWFIVVGIDVALGQAISAGYVPAEIISTAETGAVRFALVGLGLLLLMVFRPQGIMGRREEMVLDDS